jgi:Cys-rich protein (TIGR01571 family)
MGDLCVNHPDEPLRSVADFPVGCRATWLPCVVYSQNKQRLRQFQHRGTPIHGAGQFFNNDCCFYCCVSMPFPSLCWVLQVRWGRQSCKWELSHQVFQMGNRTDIRTRYSIRGSGGNDCLTVLCCRPCALTQEHRELLLEQSIS